MITIYPELAQVVTGMFCVSRDVSIFSSSTYGERRGAYRALVGEPEVRRPLRRSRRRREDNIKIDL